MLRALALGWSEKWRVRLSRVIAVTATALVLIDALAIVLLVSAAVSTVRLGFRIIRRHDIFGAAEIGALLSAHHRGLCLATQDTAFHCDRHWRFDVAGCVEPGREQR